MCARADVLAASGLIAGIGEGVLIRRCVRGLQFPLAVEAHVIDGVHALACRPGEVPVPIRGMRYVPALRRFDYTVQARNGSVCRIVPVDATAAGIAQRLALEVFERPEAEWNRVQAARALNVDPHELSVKLFREGCALTEIVRTQRLMRAFVEIAAGRESLLSAMDYAGLGSAARLRASFRERFGFSADALTIAPTLARSRWHP
jgi:AraC-like DNA-binding protein